MRNAMIVLLVFCCCNGMGAIQAQPVLAPTSLRIEVFKLRDFARVSYNLDKRLVQDNVENFLAKLGTRTIGSGFVMEYKGKNYVVTNYHVIQYHDPDTASIRALLPDNRQYILRFVGGDSVLDIAFLEAETDLEFVYPYTVGDEQMLSDTAAIAVAFPGRRSERGNLYRAQARSPFNKLPGYLLHNVRIRDGDSGSPLLAEDGKLIGVNTLYLNTNDRSTQSYALGISNVLRILERIENRQPVRCYLGIEFGYDTEKKCVVARALVANSNSPANNSISPVCLNQKIRSINGKDINSLEDVINALDVQSIPGDLVSIRFDCANQPTAQIKVAPFGESQLAQVGQHFAKNLQWTPEIQHDTPRVYVPTSCEGNQKGYFFIRRMDVTVPGSGEPVTLAITSWADLGRAVCAHPFTRQYIGLYENLSPDIAPIFCDSAQGGSIFH